MCSAVPELLAAPMEGVTGYVFRNVHRRYYGGIARYYTPFLVPLSTHRFSPRERRDILPENNGDVLPVPQLLTNRAEHFVWAAKELLTLGYREINLNLGCPSGTVVPKRRGAGFLAFPRELDAFLYQVTDALAGTEARLSVKTRAGLADPEEFPELLEIFNRYPLKLLIVHPRVRTDYYRGPVRTACWELAAAESRNPLCYNGDLFCAGDVQRFLGRYPQTGSLMLGRGLIANPALAAQLALGETPDKEKLRAFWRELAARFREAVPDEKNVMFKLKELWFYLEGSFAEADVPSKKIQKTKSLAEFLAAVERFFDERELSAQPGFLPGRAAPGKKP